MRVLVVDESAERTELLRAALAPAGYEVTALSSPLGLLQAIEKLQPDLILVAAAALLEEMRNLHAQLADANQKLSERKLVERAKGMLMKSRGLDEDAAYALLRRMAMDRKMKLAELAQRFVDAADLLGA
jgi:AmiR/NasT family two-component response regulator